MRHFDEHERAVWQGGHWGQEWHNGRYGWWWYTGGGWYFYDQPVYPYPLIVSDAVVFEPVVDVPVAPAYAPPPAPLGAPPPSFWYYCDNPPGYYPYVPSCPTQYREVPAGSR